MRSHHPHDRGRRERNLRLERLEDRKLLDASSVLAEAEYTIRAVEGETLEVYRVWTVEGDDNDNVIVVRKEGDFLTVEIDGQWQVGPPSRDVDHIKVFGRAGNDQIVIQDSVPQTTGLDGGRGHDTIVGSLQDDTIIGGWGNDNLYGREGNDRIYGDVLHVEQRLRPALAGAKASEAAAQPKGGHVEPPAADIIWGGEGDDVLYGHAGDDQLYGGVGRDDLYGGSGDDWLEGGVGDDLLDGDSGTDTFIGGHGADIVYAVDGEVDYIFPDEDDQLFFDRGIDIFPVEPPGR